jgi:hypothetical protein
LSSVFNDPNIINLVYLLVIILVPIIPGFIFFKWLESSGSVGGKWQGWTIKVGGAFSGYFAIFLLLLYILHPKITPPEYHPLWSLVGEISDDPKITDPERQIHFISSAETFTGKAYSDRRFEVHFRKSNDEDFPDISLLTEPQADFQSFTIRLSRIWKDSPTQGVEIKRSDSDRTITVKGIKIAKTGGLPFSPSPTPTQ